MTVLATRVISPRRDYVDLPGLELDPLPMPDDVSGYADELFRGGTRHVTLDGPVDLADPESAADTVRTLVLIRDLTAFGIPVGWTVRLPEGLQLLQLPFLLGHLHPPSQVLGSAHASDTAGLWARRFHLGMCFWRHGPGFIEVRDLRSSPRVRLVIDDPGRLAAVEVLSRGAHAAQVPGDVMDDFTAGRLVHRVGQHAWWVPYRIRRWPSPPMIV